MKSIQEIRHGNNHPSLRKVPNDCGVTIISVDPNGREFVVCLETKTGIEAEKWVAALQELLAACTNSSAQHEE